MKSTGLYLMDEYYGGRDHNIKMNQEDDEWVGGRSGQRGLKRRYIDKDSYYEYDEDFGDYQDDEYYDDYYIDDVDVYDEEEENEENEYSE